MAAAACDLSTTSIAISHTSGSARTLTLGGAGDLGDSVTGAVTGDPNLSDLLYVASGSPLNLFGGTGATALALALGQSGNFDIAGTSTLSSIISGSSFGITKTAPARSR